MIDSIEDWVDGVIKEYGSSSSPEDCLVYIARECTKRRSALLHLFDSVDKDIFLSRINKISYGFVKTYVDNHVCLSLDEKDKLIKSYKWIFVGSLLDWLEEDGDYDLVTMYANFCRIFKGSSERVKSK